ncbi:hypothetical protein TSAR_015696 [Trichomalopsis sarcophagae]|uniref:Uncharacterized protein n=1 Tax=Trichomalopsis sarcophagae TaxID=543379 RepID=A0A232FDH2_9HYME|nr:hypothetical protein TSAR_015696 [Trichomalopsis sarcophagae]
MTVPVDRLPIPTITDSTTECPNRFSTVSISITVERHLLHAHQSTSAGIRLSRVKSNRLLYKLLNIAM